jgi:hypothetical protein
VVVVDAADDFFGMPGHTDFAVRVAGGEETEQLREDRWAACGRRGDESSETVRLCWSRSPTRRVRENRLQRVAP